MNTLRNNFSALGKAKKLALGERACVQRQKRAFYPLPSVVPDI